MPVSIYDIAERANVSPSTVSRALQDNPQIGAKTKQRILAIAKELDYVPSAIARSLIENRTRTIGMVLPSVADPFMGRIVEGVEQLAVENDLTVFLSTSHNNLERELAIIQEFEQRRVDAIIIYASDLNAPYAEYVRRNRVPTVVINEQEPGGVIHAVGTDEGPSAQRAIAHLIELGHRRIAYVGISNRPKSNQHRLNGYRAALEQAGIEFDPALVIASDAISDYTMCGEASLQPLLALGATAAFCFNDLIAIGMLTASHRIGLKVPTDLSIVGFDDIDMAAHTFPPLTTIRQHRYELGRLGMQMVLDLLDDKRPERIVVPGELIVRGSTAPLALGS